jgi:hypothetical protein
MPITAEDKALFNGKQTYMFAVFEKTLMTDQGKACVREFGKEADAQSIYRSICKHALTSTKASIEASESLTYVTSTRLGEGSSWRGSTHSFVLHWQNQVRLYEAQVAIDEHFSSGQKKTMLQNAVRHVPQLCSVNTQADHLNTHDGKDLTYDSYVKLLLSAASTYDSQFAPKTFSCSRPPRRAVYSHDVTEPYYGDSDAFYDSAVVYAMAATPGATRQRPRLPWSGTSSSTCFNHSLVKSLTRRKRTPMPKIFSGTMNAMIDLVGEETTIHEDVRKYKSISAVEFL